jgi:hypothetical protein
MSTATETTQTHLEDLHVGQRNSGWSILEHNVEHVALALVRWETHARPAACQVR